MITYQNVKERKKKKSSHSFQHPGDIGKSDVESVLNRREISITRGGQRLRY